MMAAAARGATLLAQLPRRVRIVEVGPRDGLQNEPKARLAAAGAGARGG